MAPRRSGVAAPKSLYRSAEVEPVGAGRERATAVARPAPMYSISGSGPLEQIAVGVEDELGDALAVPSGPGGVRRARLGHVGMVHLVGREAAAPERRRLRRTRCSPGRATAASCRPQSWSCSRRCRPRGSCGRRRSSRADRRSGPFSTSQCEPSASRQAPPNGIAEAVREDEVLRRECRRRRRRTGCRRRGPVELDAQDLAAHGGQILRRRGEAGRRRCARRACRRARSRGSRSGATGPRARLGKSRIVVWVVMVRPPSVLCRRHDAREVVVGRPGHGLDGADEQVAAERARRRCRRGPFRPSPERCPWGRS